MSAREFADRWPPRLDPRPPLEPRVRYQLGDALDPATRAAMDRLAPWWGLTPLLHDHGAVAPRLRTARKSRLTNRAQAIHSRTLKLKLTFNLRHIEGERC